jgi:hypothetical protein
MPSIFIWKAEEPCSSKRQIKYYSGSNWSLEDSEYGSKSYMFLDQIVLSELNNSVITYRAAIMPQDWVGSELLEVSSVSYMHIKTDNYGTLDRIGNWMRFISRGEIEYGEVTLRAEFKRIQQWARALAVREEKQVLPTIETIVQKSRTSGYHNRKQHHNPKYHQKREYRRHGESSAKY